MKLSENAIETIKHKDHLRLRNRLALELDVHSSSVERWLKDNETDGPLTRASALKMIVEETGLLQDEILTNESAAA